MSVRFHKRSRKRRGTRSVGWGRIGQHRKAGSKGGTGKSGRHKHKWSWTVKYGKDTYGKHGFKRPYSLGPEKVINLDRLGELLSASGKLEIDLTELGYTKLLSEGNVNHPMRVKIARASKKAIEKIKSAGGEVLLEETQ